MFPVAVRAIALQTDSTRANLIFILTDQWRGQALGFLGIEPVLTPNLDNLAKKKPRPDLDDCELPALLAFPGQPAYGQLSH